MKRRQQKCRWMLGWSNWIAEPKMLHNSPSARRRRVRTSLSTFSNHSHGAVVKQALKMEAEYGRYKIMRKAGHGTYMCVYYIIFIHIINYIYYIFIILYIIYIVYIIYYIYHISYIYIICWCTKIWSASIIWEVWHRIQAGDNPTGPRFSLSSTGANCACKVSVAETSVLGGSLASRRPGTTKCVFVISICSYMFRNDVFYMYHESWKPNIIFSEEETSLNLESTWADPFQLTTSTL